MKLTTSVELVAQVERQWSRGALLRARLDEETIFPMRLKLRRPTSREITNSFDEVQRWIRELTDNAREQRGYGYDLEWASINLRVHGQNELPTAAIVPTEHDALRLIRKTGPAERFSKIAEETLSAFPLLRAWVARHPLRVLQSAEQWDRLLRVVGYFESHPRPGCYRRQLDIRGVDTKFIEAHRGLLAELLDAVLPADAIDTDAKGVRYFDRRYGLREDPPRIRFRVLDPNLAVGGLTDLSITPEEFRSLDLDCGRVFVTENKVNGLALPYHRRAIVIFGLGYGLVRLHDVRWLHRADIFYWGDIDTHGFAILDRFREHFPTATSFLMDRDTLMSHQEFWSREEQAVRDTARHLTPDETALYDDLCANRWGESVRLEQERIRFPCIDRALAALDT